MVLRESAFKLERERSSFNNNDGEHTYDADTASITSSTSGGEDFVNGVVGHTNNGYQSSFGSISVTNSNDIHFGNKTFYQGPVTIKQFVYASNSKPANSENVVSDGVFNISGETNNISTQSYINTDDVKCISDNLGVKQNTDVRNNVGKINNNVEVEHANCIKGAGWFHDLPRKQMVFVIALSIVLVTSLVVSTAVLLTRNSIIANGIINYPSDEMEQQENCVDKCKDNNSIALPAKLKIISRGEWVAQPPTQPISPLILPVPYVIIMHTATEPCTNQGACVFHIRHIQMYHVESRHWWDIGYNFLVGGDGSAYEGRGWKSEGAHTYGYNTKSIGIGLIGTFTSVLPLPCQITTTKQLIAKGVELGYIAKDYKLLGAKQLQSTDSPGKLFFEELKLWDHWSEKP